MKYIILEIENTFEGHYDYTSYDVMKEDKSGCEFVAEFHKKIDANLFARIKNKRK